MGLFHYLWSRTAASNSTADSNVNWAEGMAPSAVNDSARAMMASAAGFRDDIAGAIVTGGTSTAYTVTSYQIFDSLAHMSGQLIAFTPHTTNGATVTLNVDGLGAKPLRSAPSVELLAGVLIQGSPYTALYNNSDSAWYLQNFFGNPYQVPLGAGMDYWGTTTPNGAFAFPAGQQISQTTYAALYTLFGSNRYGADGGGLFYLPDKTGRVSAMKESTATRLTSGVGGVDGGTLGAASSSQTQTITQANLPNINLTSNAQNVTVKQQQQSFAVSAGGQAIVTNLATVGGGGISDVLYPVGGQTVPLGGSGTGHPSVQPTIICNYIIRVL